MWAQVHQQSAMPHVPHTAHESFGFEVVQAASDGVSAPAEAHSDDTFVDAHDVAPAAGEPLERLVEERSVEWWTAFANLDV